MFLTAILRTGTKNDYLFRFLVPERSVGILSGCNKAISERGPVKIEPMIDGVVGFIFLTTRKTPTDKGTWESRFKRIYNSYNEVNAIQLLLATPHTCRHTFCTDMALRGMNPKTLQHIMGHADIVVTLRIYAYLQTKDIFSEYWKVANRVTREK